MHHIYLRKCIVLLTDSVINTVRESKPALERIPFLLHTGETLDPHLGPETGCVTKLFVILFGLTRQMPLWASN
jgi:hypothetical protein